MALRSSYDYTVSIIVVSFNARELLRECLNSLQEECAQLPEGKTAEVIVVDNASIDRSGEMVERDFSGARTPVRLIQSDVNLGFGAANNLAVEEALGNYLVLLDSGAYFHRGALACALEHMETDSRVGVGGARLVGRDGEAQPSARVSRSILRDALMLSGFSARPGRSEHATLGDAILADADQPAEVDWVTGAFMILRREALLATGLFDPDYFLYCEEVDLCRRVKKTCFKVMYWPDVVVKHLGGESSRTLSAHFFSESEAQVVLWRMRSTLLYFRKHFGWKAWLARWLEVGLYVLRKWRNRFTGSPARRNRGREAAMRARLMRQAWRETNGGRVSPPRPW